MLGSLAIGKDGRVNHLTATATLPGIERTDKIIILLGVHLAFAFWTFHDGTSLVMESEDRRCPIGDA